MSSLSATTWRFSVAFMLRSSLSQMPVEETRDVGKGFPGLRRVHVEAVLRVRLALIDVELGGDAGTPQLAMRAHRVGEEEVARAAGQDGRRKAVEIAVDRRQDRVPHVVAGGIELGGAAKPAVPAH